MEKQKIRFEMESQYKTLLHLTASKQKMDYEKVSKHLRAYPELDLGYNKSQFFYTAIYREDATLLEIYCKHLDQMKYSKPSTKETIHSEIREYYNEATPADNLEAVNKVLGNILDIEDSSSQGSGPGDNSLKEKSWGAVLLDKITPLSDYGPLSPPCLKHSEDKILDDFDGNWDIVWDRLNEIGNSNSNHIDHSDC